MPEFTHTDVKTIVDYIKDAKQRLGSLAAIEKLAIANQRQIEENQRQIQKNQAAIEKLYEVVAGKLTNGKKGLLGRVEDLEEAERERREAIAENKREAIRLRYTIIGGIVVGVVLFLVQLVVK